MLEEEKIAFLLNVNTMELRCNLKVVIIAMLLVYADIRILLVIYQKY